MRSLTDRLPYLWLLLALFTLPLAGCGESNPDPDADEDDGGPGPVELGTLTWTVDGSATYTAEPPDSGELVAFREGESVRLVGNDFVGDMVHTILVNAPAITATGTYTVNPGAGGAASYQVRDASGAATQYVSTAAWTFRVTSLTDAAVAGSFEFTGVNVVGGGGQKEVEGAFNLSFDD